MAGWQLFSPGQEKVWSAGRSFPNPPLAPAVALAQAGGSSASPSGCRRLEPPLSAAGGQPGGCGCNRPLPRPGRWFFFPVCCSWDRLYLQRQPDVWLTPCVPILGREGIFSPSAGKSHSFPFLSRRRGSFELMFTVRKPILISPFPAQLSGEPAPGLPVPTGPLQGATSLLFFLGLSI